MISTLVYFLPCLVCVLWFFLFSARKMNIHQRYWRRVMFFSSFYYGVYAYNIIPDKDLYVIAYLDLLLIFVMFATMGSASIYVYSQVKRKAMSVERQILLYMPSLLNFAVIAVLFFLLGVDDVIGLHLAEVREVEKLPAIQPDVVDDLTHARLAKAYWFFADTSIKIQCVLISLCIVGLCIYAIVKRYYRIGHFWDFLLRGKPIKSSVLTHIVLMLLSITIIFYILIGRTFVAHNQLAGITMSLLMSVCIFLQSHVEYFNSGSYITLKNYFNNDVFRNDNALATNVQKKVEVKKADENVKVDSKNSEAEEIKYKVEEEKPLHESENKAEEGTSSSASSVNDTNEESVDSQPIAETSDAEVEEEQEDEKEEEINIPGLEDLDLTAKEAMKGMLKSVLEYTPKNTISEEDIEAEVAEFRKRKAERMMRLKQEGSSFGSPQPTEDKMEHLCNVLRELMDEKRVYMDYSLNRAKLADLMKTNRTWVTLIVREVYGKPLNILLSERRLDAVQKMLLENPQCTMEKVARACGFKNDSSLCHKFKATYGISPRAWIENKLKETNDERTDN